MRSRRIYLRSKTGKMKVSRSEVHPGKMIMENSRGHRILFNSPMLRRSVLFGSYYIDPDVGRIGDVLITDEDYVRRPSLSMIQ